MQKFSKFFGANFSERLNLTAGLSIGEYLKFPEMSSITQQIVISYIGIIVAARVQCDAYAIMSLFEAVGMFGSPKTTSELKESGLAGGNMFPGPSSKYFINPLFEYLKSNGVKFHFNVEINNLDDIEIIKSRETAIQNGTGFALCLCTPHLQTAHFLGESYFPKDMLKNEWSFGLQFYVTDLNQVSDILNNVKNQNIYNCVLGSPWQVIYVLEYSKSGKEKLKADYGYDALWGNDDMGLSGTSPILITITATISNQKMLVGKPVLMCTPEEVARETLFQIGIGEENSINILHNNMSFGSLLYVKKTEANEKFSSPMYLKGPVQPNGYMWISDYTLFITTAGDPSFGVTGMCTERNIYDNTSCVDINLLPERLNTSLTSSMTHFRGDLSQQRDKFYKSVPSEIYLAGEYCSTPNIQIPTMEKACESGKLVARKIISDFGIRDKVRVENLKKQANLTYSLDQVYSDNMTSISTLVQVQGLSTPFELINFVQPSKMDNFQILMYSSQTLNYPSWVLPIF